MPTSTTKTPPPTRPGGLAGRSAARVRHTRLTGALLASDGPEVTLARRAQATRMTVRKALGKR